MLSYMFQELTKNLSGRTPSQQHITSYVVEKFQLIPPYVSDLAGLLLHVVLAVHSVIDHQLTYI